MDCILSIFDGHLGGFQLPETLTSAAVNMRVHVLFEQVQEARA